MPWDPPERGYERFTRAVAILNAWAQEPAGPPPDDEALWIRTVFSYLDEGVESAELVIGFVELAGALLTKLEAYGDDPQAVLADVAARYRP